MTGQTAFRLVLPSMTEAAIAHAPYAQSGIASGMLNVSRQPGGVIGVAILGTLVGNPQTFLPGMHLAFGIVGGVLLLGLRAAWVFVPADRKETLWSYLFGLLHHQQHPGSEKKASFSIVIGSMFYPKSCGLERDC